MAITLLIWPAVARENERGPHNHPYLPFRAFIETPVSPQRPMETVSSQVLGDKPGSGARCGLLLSEADEG